MLQKFPPGSVWYSMWQNKDSSHWLTEQYAINAHGLYADIPSGVHLWIMSVNASHTVTKQCAGHPHLIVTLMSCDEHERFDLVHQRDSMYQCTEPSCYQIHIHGICLQLYITRTHCLKKNNHILRKPVRLGQHVVCILQHFWVLELPNICCHLELVHCYVIQNYGLAMTPPVLFHIQLFNKFTYLLIQLKQWLKISRVVIVIVWAY